MKKIHFHVKSEAFPTRTTTHFLTCFFNGWRSEFRWGGNFSKSRQCTWFVSRIFYVSCLAMMEHGKDCKAFNFVFNHFQNQRHGSHKVLSAIWDAYNSSTLSFSFSKNNTTITIGASWITSFECSLIKKINKCRWVENPSNAARYRPLQNNVPSAREQHAVVSNRSLCKRTDDPHLRLPSPSSRRVYQHFGWISWGSWEVNLSRCLGQVGNQLHHGRLH